MLTNVDLVFVMFAKCCLECKHILRRVIIFSTYSNHVTVKFINVLKAEAKFSNVWSEKYYIPLNRACLQPKKDRGLGGLLAELEDVRAREVRGALRERLEVLLGQLHLGMLCSVQFLNSQCCQFSIAKSSPTLTFLKFHQFR